MRDDVPQIFPQYRNRRVALLLFAMLWFWSCESGQSDKTELVFWAMGAEGEHVMKLVPQFEAENPGIHVTVQSIPWGAAYEKLLTAYAGQATPDVCQLGNTWVPQFAMLDAILPLDSLITTSRIVQPEAYFEGVWKTNVVNSKVYGVPWYVDTRLLFYRSDIFENAGYAHPPQTWEEWIDISRKISNLDKQKYAVFFSLIFNDWQVPVILIMSNGGSILKENNCYGAFDDPKTVAALSYYIDFFRNGFAPRTMTEFANIYQGFENGDFAMTITGPWNVNEIRRRSPGLAGKWSTAPMPEKVHSNSVAGGASLVVFRTTEHPEAAWKFVEFLSGKETQIEFFNITSDLPAVRSAWESPQLQNDPEIRAFFEQLNTVQPTPPIAEWEQIAVKIQEYLEKVIYEQVTLEVAIQQLNREVDRILEKRRWLLENDLLYN